MTEHEHSSIEEAGGCATGFTGTVENWNADAEQRFADTLFQVGRFVQGESGCLLGHIKAAVYVGDGEGLTLNLIDMDNGVEHHGALPRNDLVKFNFMCAVLDVEEDELLHIMIHAIDDSGLDYHIDRESLGHHHHHHGEHHHDECNCHDEEHHHHDDEECCCHHHENPYELIDENGKLRTDHHCHHHHHDGEHHEDGHCHHLHGE